MMLAAAATRREVFRGYMPSDSRHTPPSEQAAALSEALRSLRERAGMTQQAAADALGVTRQAWQNYEAGARPTILRTDLQDRLAEALGLEREDLIRERDRLAGGGHARAPAGMREEGKAYELPILGRVRAGSAGPQIYDITEPEGFVDVSWLFGPHARILRAAGDSMSGYVESGQIVVYDTSVWPSRGQGCVIELVNGEVYVKEYQEVAQGVLKVRQRFPEETLSFPMADVRGVYQVRLRGG